MSSIDKSSWLALSPLLDDLLDSDAPTRERKLRDLAARDPQVAAELRSMLVDKDAVEEAGFLEQPILTPAAQAGIEGQVVDRYTLDRQIGEGGMGTVWLAHRSDGRYEGQVAIKFLSLPSIGSAGRARFDREGHVLARLKHPNIAHLLDAGVTQTGQPYLVLEYVQGEPIDVWCRTRELGVNARVELLLQVLGAVTHAHGKLILHRDLKPSNILVNAEGQAKLLDFGIAKLLEDEQAPAQATEMTQMAGRAFTLDYASPEQIQGGEVTTATDVYSLGVLLYVILTDQHPTAGDSITPADRIRAVVDTEPKRASAVVSKTKDHQGDSRFQSERVRALRGDLDNIVAKALKKSPHERYPTADAFAQDLRRYLNNEPVSARADSLAYRARKFIVRNTLSVAAAATVMLAIIAAAIVSIWQAQEATRQRDRALALSTRNAAVVDFVNSMLTEVAPDDRPIRMSEVLERSEQLLVAADIAPEHQAATLDLLAEYHLSAGNSTKAQALLDRAVELSANSGDSALRATIICNRGHALSLMNERDKAIAELEHGIRLSRVDPLAASRCFQKRAYVAQNFNDAENALKYTLEAQASLRESGMSRADQEASLIGDLAYAYYMSGHTAEADHHYADALERYAKLGRAESPATFSIRNNWGIASFAAGDNRRALENYDEAIRIAKQRNPEADPPAYLLTNRALALASLARFPEAMEAFDVALAAAQRVENVASQLHGLVNRAGTYMLTGDIDRAARELESIEKKYSGMIPSDSVPAVTIQYIKGRIATSRGESQRALQLLTSTIDFFEKRQMQVAPVTRALNARAEVHIKRGELTAARSDAQRALEISRKLQSTKTYSSLTGASLLQHAEVESAAGDQIKAKSLASDALDNLTQALGPQHPDALR
ncbi:MAG TPA: protein kinase, partial [Steroidobacteraceae bacterium]|nr:protein kinase [Steroidobacteraceae bacterium]